MAVHSRWSHSSDLKEKTMRRSAFVVIAFSLLFASSAALALNGRSAVSVNGSDLNTCTTTSPCRSFTTAVAATSPGGEVIALDSGGYGPFSTSQSVTVVGAPGIYAAVSAGSGIGIHITTLVSEVVTLRNLALLGLGTGLTGIFAPVGAGPVHIIDCSIRAFQNQGINSGAVMTFIDGVSVVDNISALAIQIVGTAASPASTYITHSMMANDLDGLYALSYATVEMDDTAIFETAIAAEAVAQASGSLTEVTVSRCTISGNSLGVLATQGAGTGTARVRLTGNVISNNGTGAQAATGGTVYTFGNNSFSGNSADLFSGTVLSAIALR
jgi:hypothetical protein